MGRKKISDYVSYPTSIVDGKKIVGNLTKQAIAYPDKHKKSGYVMRYQDKITLDKSLTDTSLSKNSPKHREKTVQQYDPVILDTRSRIHSKKYGSKYTLILDSTEVWIELAQIGKNDDRVRFIRLGLVDNNRCFIPDQDIRFENKLIDFYLLCEYIGVSVKSLLDQCKAIAAKCDPFTEYEKTDNFHQRKQIVKKTQIR